ncbi:hypothetical protein NM688_g7190 [Phlebia brevispora]|uniref:Uncharacterized protein n=1 Tax=Phlebia brevispora TaxID=194682 RepID=A0ACC1S8B3_9APHY|nr:hypothetical protein NM688_g7190 [Phlebia brevispora]
MQLNSEAKISQLPDELMGQILFVLRDMALAAPNWGIYGDWDKWVCVTHVCHRWREIALSLPLLWDHIHPCREDATATWLARSGTALLDVQYTCNLSGWPLPLALQHLPRIRSLAAEIDDDTFDTDFTWSGLPAPHLQRLFVAFEHPSLPTSMPEDLFRLGNLPSLRNLSIYGGSWYWMTAPLPETLVEMEFTFCPSWCERGMGARALAVLGRLSKLERLDITDDNSGDFSRDSLGEMTDFPHISLPSMRIFKYEGAPFVCLYLLDRITLPSSCKLTLSATACRSTQERADELVTLFNRAVILRGPAVTAVSLSFSDVFRFRMCFWKTDSPPDLPLSSTSADIDFGCHDYMDRELYPSFTRGILMYDVVGRFALHGVRTLQISHIQHYAELLDFRRILGLMPNIERMLIEEWNISGVLSILPTRLADDSDQFFLPNLRELVLEGVCFPAHSGTREGSQHLIYFLDRLKARRERGVGISSLVLRRCRHLITPLVEAMRAEVGTLEWDGKMIFHPFESAIIDRVEEYVSEGR